MRPLILIYRPIPLETISERYTISATGCVYDKHRKRLCELYDDRYIRVNLFSSSFCLHRLVAITWLPNPNNYPVVAHIDNNKRNNWVSNLQWTTQQENIADYHDRQKYFEYLTIAETTAFKL